MNFVGAAAETHARVTQATMKLSWLTGECTKAFHIALFHKRIRRVLLAMEFVFSF